MVRVLPLQSPKLFAYTFVFKVGKILSFYGEILCEFILSQDNRRGQKKKKKRCNLLSKVNFLHSFKGNLDCLFKLWY